jgi:hypothetical protein
MATPTTPSPIKTQPHQGTPPPDAPVVVAVGLTATVVLLPVTVVVSPRVETVVVEVTVRLCAGWVTVLVAVVVSVLAVAVPVWLGFAASVELDVALASSVWTFDAAVDTVSLACWASVPDPPAAQAATNDVANVMIPTRLRVAKDTIGAGRLEFSTRSRGRSILAGAMRDQPVYGEDAGREHPQQQQQRARERDPARIRTRQRAGVGRGRAEVRCRRTCDLRCS